jgi:hypothetical protein
MKTRSVRLQGICLRADRSRKQTDRVYHRGGAEMQPADGGYFASSQLSPTPMETSSGGSTS